MINVTTRLFTEHPSTVDETYFQHMRFAAGFAGWLVLAAMAAVIHAVLPFLFERTAGKIVEKLHHRIHNRHGH